MMRLTEPELVLLKVLWDSHPLHASEIAVRVGERRWSLQTIKTMLARLEGKGAIAHEEQGRRYLYRPLIDREAFLDSESQRVLDRLFDGRAAPLIARLAARQKLTPSDLDEIKSLLGKIGGG